MHRRTVSLGSVALLLGLTGLASAAGTITTETLLNDLTDLQRAFVMSEILGKPLALRRPDDARP